MDDVAQFSDPDNELVNPSISFDKGVVHMVYHAGSNGLRYVTGKLADSVDTWTNVKLPKGHGVDDHRDMAKVRLDSTGEPGVVYSIEFAYQETQARVATRLTRDNDPVEGYGRQIWISAEEGSGFPPGRAGNGRQYLCCVPVDGNRTSGSGSADDGGRGRQ